MKQKLSLAEAKMEPRKVIESVTEILREVSEDVCDNYCKFRETADEDHLCDVIRSGAACPLDRLN